MWRNLDNKRRKMNLIKTLITTFELVLLRNLEFVLRGFESYHKKELKVDNINFFFIFHFFPYAKTIRSV